MEQTTFSAVLAEIGMMARRASAGTLTPLEYRASARRIRNGLGLLGADPGGVMGGYLDALDVADQTRALTHDMVGRAARRLRERLTRVRDGSLPRAAASSRIPVRTYGRLSVIDGGRADLNP